MTLDALKTSVANNSAAIASAVDQLKALRDQIASFEPAGFTQADLDQISGQIDSATATLSAAVNPPTV